MVSDRKRAAYGTAYTDYRSLPDLSYGAKGARFDFVLWAVVASHLDPKAPSLARKNSRRIGAGECSLRNSAAVGSVARLFGRGRAAISLLGKRIRTVHFP